MNRMNQKLIAYTVAGLACVGLLVGPLASSAEANMYICKDRSGRTWFTNVKKKGHRCRLAMQFKDGAAKSGSSGVRKNGNFKPKVAGLPRTTHDNSTLKERVGLYDAYIREAATRYRIPVPFIKGVIRVESAFKYTAVSPVGAMGLMQLMPRTARAMGVTDAYDPRQNIFGGTRLLRYLANKHNGDLVKVLSAYHAGSGAVAKKGGIPFEGTEGYVRAVLKHYYAYKDTAPTAARP